MGNQPSPLRKAIRWSEVDRVKSIVEKAGDGAASLINNDHSPDCIMDSCTREASNAFHYAVRRNRIQIVRILLDHGADPYATGSYGETCMHVAARNNYVEIARILIDWGVDVRTTDDRGRHPIHRASASVFDTSEFIRFLLDRANDADYVNVRDFYDRTPLHEAASVGNTEVALTLLGQGAKVNVADKRGNTPLHLARGKPGVWGLLIERGADTNVKNNDGLSPEQMTRST